MGFLIVILSPNLVKSQSSIFWGGRFFVVDSESKSGEISCHIFGG